MLTCPNCGKENQDHYKFCLACGNKLHHGWQPGAQPSPPPQGGPPAPPRPAPPPPPAAAPAKPTEPPLADGQGGRQPGQYSGPPGPPPPPSAPPGGTAVPPSRSPGPPPVPPGGTAVPPSRPPAASPSVPSESGPTTPARASAPTGQAAPGATLTCPGCGFVNPQGFKFCGRCGTTLEQPTAAPAEDVGTARTVFVDAADEGPETEPRSGSSSRTGNTAASATPTATHPHQSSGPSAAAQPSGQSAPSASVSPSGKGGAKLVMLGPDGQPVGERVLGAGETLEVGRTCGPPWEDDAYLDPRHASLQITDDGIIIEDFGSLNGVFLKLHERVEVQNGDQFRVGQELLLYEDLPEPTPTDDGTERMGSPNPGYWGRISVLVDPDHPSLAHPIESEGITIGRETGDITFPSDGYVSGQHCQIMGDDTGVYIEDVGSSNGTYMRVRSGQLVPYGSLILIGQKLFQVEQA